MPVSDWACVRLDVCVAVIGLRAALVMKLGRSRDTNPGTNEKHDVYELTSL